jgi:ABC-2 type transport system ATP-binding protein
VGLAEFRHRLADRLSGGMKQKLALACTLIHSPRVLLLDEPTTGVDPVTRREFWQLLADLVAEGLTLLVATPYLDEAERCTRVVLMHEGAVIADAAPDEIPRMVPEQVLELAATPRNRAMEVLAAVPGVTDVAVFGSMLHVRVEGGGDPILTIRGALESAAVRVQSAEEVPVGLEDAFLYLTNEGAPLEEAS